MAYVVYKRGIWFARVKGDKQPGKWSSLSTGCADEESALAWAVEAQRQIDERARPRETILTLSRYAWDTWLPHREQTDNDWRKDRGKIKNHIAPAFGDHELAKITAAQVTAFVYDLRFKKKLAPRTVRNIYYVLVAVFRDAKEVHGHDVTSPCTLDERHLGPVEDKNPLWRKDAVYSREEAEMVISDVRIPFDRQMVYAFGMLAGLRPGEAAALRWTNYDPADRTGSTLGRLTVALSYSTAMSKVKRTKTRAVRSIPVHPTLARMLEDWMAFGWEAMMGRPPTPDDLIVPLPPEIKRTTRKHLADDRERYRGTDYTGDRWRNVDRVALGWTDGAVYDAKATFITLAVDDGASPSIIRERVTHTKPRKDAFDGYDRGVHWEETCREVSKLRLFRRVPSMLPPAGTIENGADPVAPKEGFESSCYPVQGISEGVNPAEPHTRCDPMLQAWSHGCALPDDE